MERTDEVIDSFEREWRSRRPRGYGLPLVAALCGLWFVIGVVTARAFPGGSAPVEFVAPLEADVTSAADFSADLQP